MTKTDMNATARPSGFLPEPVSARELKNADGAIELEHHGDCSAKIVYILMI